MFKIFLNLKSKMQFSDEKGAVSIEFVFMTMLFFLVQIATAASLDLFIAVNKATKANTAIANYLSHLDDTNNAQIDDLGKLYNSMALQRDRKGRTTDTTSWIRVTALLEDGDGKLHVCWSRVAGATTGVSALTSSSPEVTQRVATYGRENEQILVETQGQFTSPFMDFSKTRIINDTPLSNFLVVPKRGKSIAFTNSDITQNASCNSSEES